MFFGVQMAVYFPPVVRQLLAGDFHGVEVLGVYTVAPIVIATSTDSKFLIVLRSGRVETRLRLRQGRIWKGFPGCILPDRYELPVP